MILSPEDLRSLSTNASEAARAAGRYIASARPTIVHFKEDGTSEASKVVTEIDRKSQDLLLQSLQSSIERYSLGLLSEELDDDGSRFRRDYFWSIDPLDGTLPFVESRPGYAVSLALVSRAGEALVGVVYDPSEDTLYRAVRGQGATRNGSPWMPPPSDSQASLAVFADRSIAAMPNYARIAEALHQLSQRLGGGEAVLSLGRGAVMNACEVLRHPRACYFKFPKIEAGGGALWDFAATACLFAEAGAIATDIEGHPLELNRSGSSWMNERGVLFATDHELAKHITALYHSMPGR